MAIPMATSLWIDNHLPGATDHHEAKNVRQVRDFYPTFCGGQPSLKITLVALKATTDSGSTGEFMINPWPRDTKSFEMVWDPLPFSCSKGHNGLHSIHTLPSVALVCDRWWIRESPGISIYLYRGLHQWGVPPNGWFVTENPIKMDDFKGTPI